MSYDAKYECPYCQYVETMPIDDSKFQKRELWQCPECELECIADVVFTVRVATYRIEAEENKKPKQKLKL